MLKTYSFTIKSYPINDLLELDLENHMNLMAVNRISLKQTPFDSCGLQLLAVADVFS